MKVCTIDPDWSKSVTEVLEWKTDVLQSPTGAEQRIARRLSPRRTFEFTSLLSDDALQKAVNWLYENGRAEFLLPIYQDCIIYEKEIAQNQTRIEINVTGYDFAQCNAVMISSDDKFEVIEIMSYSDNFILVSPIKSHFASGSCIYPLRKAVLTDAPALTLSRLNACLTRLQMRFRIAEHNAHDDSVTLPTYRGFHVLTIPQDWQADVSTSMAQLMQELDNLTGLIARTDTAKRAFYTTEFNFQLFDRVQQYQLRRIFYYLRGRQRVIWVSTNCCDITPVMGIQSGKLMIKAIDLQAKHCRDICITLTDDSQIYCRITSVNKITGGHEFLTIDNQSLNINQHDIAMISFIFLSRLESDSIEWEHITDADGVAQVSVNFRALRDELE